MGVSVWHTPTPAHKRVCQSPEYFPAIAVERQLRKLQVILDAYHSELGFEPGEEDVLQASKQILALALTESERLQRHLKEGAAKLDLACRPASQTPLSGPDHESQSAIPSETQASVSA
jgi:hypothetical protein